MNKLFSALAVVVVALAMASCSIINGNLPILHREKPTASASDGTADSKQQAASTQAKPSATQTKTADAQAKPAATQTKPADTQTKPATTQAKPSATHSKPAGEASKFAGKIDGEWYILKAGASEVIAEEAPYVYFEEGTGKFYANDGCNIINGAFTLSDENVTFSNVLTTRMSCPGMAYAASISRTLSGETPVKIVLKDTDYVTVMTLKSAAGAELMILTRHNFGLVNGQWYVKRIGDMEIDDENVNIFFDFADMTTHGNTGCNFFNGKIIINPHMANSVSFTQMGTTMRFCPDSDVEMSMLVALEQATAYRLDGHKLILLDSAGTKLMTLARE